MRPSTRFELALAAILCIWGAFHAQAQTAPAHCSADGSPRDENGRPHCCPDGSSPEGGNQCWCDLRIIHLREYRNPQHEYGVQVPDGMAEILPGCSGVGAGFRISLTHPDSGESEGELPWSMIWVSRSERTNQTLQEIADGFAQNIRVDSDRVHATDLRIDQPVPASLSSLAALDLKAARTELNHGTLIREEIVAKSPDRYVYLVGMISPADQYEKNEKLFQQIADGFRYVPSRLAASQ